MGLQQRSQNPGHRGLLPFDFLCRRRPAHSRRLACPDCPATATSTTTFHRLAKGGASPWKSGLRPGAPRRRCACRGIAGPDVDSSPRNQASGSRDVDFSPRNQASGSPDVDFFALNHAQGAPDVDFSALNHAQAVPGTGILWFAGRKRLPGTGCSWFRSPEGPVFRYFFLAGTQAFRISCALALASGLTPGNAANLSISALAPEQAPWATMTLPSS